MRRGSSTRLTTERIIILTFEQPHQEVWITLRLKGSMPIDIDPEATAQTLLKRIETFLSKPEMPGGWQGWRRFLHRPTPSCRFTLTQQGDVIEIEEEAAIYDTG